MQVIAVEPPLCSATVARADAATTFKVSVRRVSLHASVELQSAVLLEPPRRREKLPASLCAL